MKGVPLEVIGLLAARGQSGGGRDQDDVVLIPFTTAETKVLGVAAPRQAQPHRADLDLRDAAQSVRHPAQAHRLRAT